MCVCVCVVALRRAVRCDVKRHVRQAKKLERRRRRRRRQENRRCTHTRKEKDATGNFTVKCAIFPFSDLLVCAIIHSEKIFSWPA